MKRTIYAVWLPALALMLSACLGVSGQKHQTVRETGREKTAAQAAADTPTEARIRAMGLVEITEIDPLIRLDLVYATTNNYMGVVLYEDLRKAFLVPAAAEKLTHARRRLQAERPELTLLVFDAARPFSVQERFWEEANRIGKTDYVSDPKKGGGLHNYGAAVDLTLCDAAGVPLPMGSGFDQLGPESHTDREQELVKEGKITAQELENRLLLRRVMIDAGFKSITSEWWHFNHIGRKEAIATLQRIE